MTLWSILRKEKSDALRQTSTRPARYVAKKIALNLRGEIDVASGHMKVTHGYF